MTDKLLLESISDADRKKLLNRWWDIVFLVLGILGAIFCLLVVMSMTPEDRSSGEVIFAVILFFVVPPIILLLLGLRKKIFWSKAKQDAYILKRLAKQALKEQGSQSADPTVLTDVVVETLPKKIETEEILTTPDPEPVDEHKEQVEVEKQELEPVIEPEEDEPEEIILFPEV